VAGQDVGSIGDDIGRVARDLERTAQEMRQAVADVVAVTHETSSPDGQVRVTVDGRPRVIGLYLDPSALDQGADQLDTVLTATLNEALAAAHAATGQALVGRLPPSLRAGIESIVDVPAPESDR
jgi:DNA-binding protein YbaB